MHRRVCIGVTLHAEPETLLETLRFVRLHTDPSVELILLPDGADDQTCGALTDDPVLSSLVQMTSVEARGSPAAFNRLAASTDAAVIVLLESGSLVGPRWLELLLAALEQPGCGLAGPSTNMAWNDQAVGPPLAAVFEFEGAPSAAVRADTLVRVQAAAARTLRRFGATVRPLGPLHSLSDFCYAVRREVVTAVGGADEGYGLGPCWEMDYNIRASRAGFADVWACGAYVHRSPLTDRRQSHEAEHHQAGRRRYQDRFCGLRLTGRAELYEPSCRGDACEHFAPAHLVSLHMPVRAAARRPEQPCVPAPSSSVTTPSRQSANPRPPTSSTDFALVSCVMPTRGRTRFALQAAHYFQQQDYPRTELVIVEDGDPLLTGSLPDDPRIRLVSSGCVRSIGVMRNEACARAAGEILVLWDDDDWHGPERVSRQVAPILAGDADVTALRDVPLFHLASWRTWRWSAHLHRRMLALDVLGGTLAFRRSVWEQRARFPDVSLAEDAAFLREAVHAGARLEAVDGTDVYVYIRHRANTWQLECGESEDPEGWMTTNEPSLAESDLAFYRALADADGSLEASEREQVMPW